MSRRERRIPRRRLEARGCSLLVPPAGQVDTWCWLPWRKDSPESTGADNGMLVAMEFVVELSQLEEDGQDGQADKAGFGVTGEAKLASPADSKLVARRIQASFKAGD